MEDLQRDGALQLRVHARVHDAHRALAEGLAHLEAAKCRGRAGGGMLASNTGRHGPNDLAALRALVEMRIEGAHRVRIGGALHERPEHEFVGAAHASLYFLSRTHVGTHFFDRLA